MTTSLKTTAPATTATVKSIYGTRDGHYEAATSNGWQDEAYATEMAVFELDAQTQAARKAVEKGE